MNPSERLPASSERLPASSERLPASAERLPASSERLPASSERLPASAEADLRAVAPAWTGARAAVRAPIDPATWRAVAQAGIAVLFLTTLGALVVSFIPLAAALIVLVIGLPLLTWVLVAVGGLATAERARLNAQLLVTIPTPVFRGDVRSGRHWWLGSAAVLGDPRRWAQAAYFALTMLLSAVELVAVGALLGGPIGLLIMPLFAHGGRAGATSVTDALITRPWWLWPGLALGLVLIWVGPLLVQGLTFWHVRLARVLLGPSAGQETTEQLVRRVDALRVTRAEAVDAADAERRRIERDLHDGAQQRLVALGVELGMARRAAGHDPEQAAGALEHAHEEVKEVLAELRDLVRGIHPAVLTDRGLDAALAGLAARCPVPVAVTVTDPDAVARLPQATQAAAYFCAAEALTNVARHAGASSAGLTLAAEPARLILTVSDDGRGGAASTPGGGLAGLQARVSALDGTLTIDSPVGVGTTVTVVI